MIVYTKKQADWLQWIVPERFNDEDLFRIVVFFVFHSPCSDITSMSKTLLEYGWHAPWKSPYYLNKHLKNASSNFDLLFSAKTYEDMDRALKEADLYDDFPNDLRNERICFYNNCNNQFMSVFYHLRNAFAHCRLNMIDVDGECTFVLEDMVKTKKGLKVSARMILRKATLLNWIDIIEQSEKEYKKE